ncbi:MAG: glycosyltransferase [Paludibacteraceae bacterium]|nr:glycosyltransferase [Paludibacteraceae bacterium]
MRILVLCDAFTGPAYKPRLRSLCDYLHESGHYIKVISEKAEQLSFPHQYKINEVEIYRYGSSFCGKIDWAWKNVLTILFNYKEYCFLDKIKELTKGENFDLVFCTSFYSFPLTSAIAYSQEKHIPCILDLRDIVEQAPNSQSYYLSHNSKWLRLFAKWYVKISLNRRNKALGEASAVTTVSPWHVKVLSRYNTNCHLIYNGYDKKEFFAEDIKSDEFRLVYTGKVFPLPHQNISIFFEALREIKLPDLKVVIHTNDQGRNLIERYIKEYEINESIIDIRPFINLSDIADLLRKSSICLVFSNKASDSSVHGMMTTKFFEALGTEKPVLCVRSDEECLADVIRDTNAGLAANNAIEIKAFIEEKYAEWKAKGFTRQKVKNKEIFSRQYESEQFLKLFERIAGK